MPLHWIYSPEDIRRKVGHGDAAFLEPPESPFYKYPVGKLSPFGFEALTTLESIVNRGGVSVRCLPHWCLLWPVQCFGCGPRVLVRNS